MNEEMQETQLPAQLERKLLVLALDLLQAQDIGTDFGNDPPEGTFAQADRVRVPRGDAKGQPALHVRHSAPNMAV